MDKTETKVKEFGTYQVGEKTYRLVRLTLGRFQEFLNIVGNLPVGYVLSAANIINSAYRDNKLPDVDPGPVIQAALQTLGMAKEEDTLVKLGALALGVEEKEARELDYDQGIEVIVDFFSVNGRLLRERFPIMDQLKAMAASLEIEVMTKEEAPN